VDFLANENIPILSIAHLRHQGYTVHSISEEFPGIDDRDVLKIAVERKAIILTFDRDYGELIYNKKLPTPPGVIYFRFVPFHPQEPAELLLAYLKIKEVDLTNHFNVLDRSKLRQRKFLPS
jgi:predicted nuclease of predicted toxin-antitoxin system